ncbi:hypothetical protein SPV1_04793 [Mariprofundus ferrooxydans PV-1]|uniref:Uncharacterized protein n=1 Tax=Mariprofundus ferrooxydans PV-1 TaxID=314345 RepID=Q0F332_9PROT|nr:hypothetical protein SPV1_04793 [Mariprofundus ferrooxydans PV-1]
MFPVSIPAEKQEICWPASMQKQGDGQSHIRYAVFRTHWI